MLKKKDKIDFPQNFPIESLDCPYIDEVTGEIECSDTPAPIKYVTTTLTDENGEVVYSSTRQKKYANGSGFVISYTEKMCEFLTKVSTGSVVRTFLYIAHHQNYGTDGKTFGYRCSHKYLRQVLRLNKSTLWDALKYLRENYLVHVGKVEGYVEFMVNPDYVTIGQDKKARRSEWNRRWAESLKQTAQKQPQLDSIIASLKE